MKIRSTEETVEAAYEFSSKILGMQLEKKAIDERIKKLKDEYKEEGIAVSLVSRILGKLKAKQKLSEGEIMEEEILTEKLEANDEIQAKISDLL